MQFVYVEESKQLRCETLAVSFFSIETVFFNFAPSRLAFFKCLEVLRTVDTEKENIVRTPRRSLQGKGYCTVDVYF